MMDTNTIIKGLVKEFEMAGTKEFLKNFNVITRRVDKMSMFIGKVKNVTFMCNGQALMGYVNMKDQEAIKFTFKSLNQLPWTNVYDRDLKLKLKQAIDIYFKTDETLMRRYELIMEAAKDYENILLRALKGKVLKVQELRKETQLLISNITKDNEEVACDIDEDKTNSKINNVEDQKEDNENIRKEDITMNVMQLAHKIRREEKLEGHYYAQMKYALQKAHAILNSETYDNNEHNNIKQEEIKNTNENVANDSDKEQENINQEIYDPIYEDLDEYYDEFEEDESACDYDNPDSKLSAKEIIAKYKGQYDAYIYIEGYKVFTHIQGKSQSYTYNYKGIRLEREFARKINSFNRFNKTLIIHHYDVFEPHDKVDFIMIP